MAEGMQATETQQKQLEDNGMAAGYFGGAIDWLVGMASDTFIAFPFYLLVIVIAFASGAGSHGIFITYLLVGWLIYCKVARGQSAALKKSARTFFFIYLPPFLRELHICYVKEIFALHTVLFFRKWG